MAQARRGDAGSVYAPAPPVEFKGPIGDHSRVRLLERCEVAVILRVFEGRVNEGDEGRLAQFVREEAVAQVLSIPGLISFQPAWRPTPDGLRVVIVSTWRDFPSLLATGRDLRSPIAIPRAGGMIRDGRADHYELAIGGARGIPIRGSTLAIVRGRLTPKLEGMLFAGLRARAQPMLDDAELLALHVGRRMGDEGPDVIGVSLWAGPVLEGGGRTQSVVDRLLGEELAACFVDPPEAEVFDALTVGDGTVDAVALMLADDERRYLHVTSAAAALVGRSVARILTLRLDDLVAPELRASVPEIWEQFVADGSLDDAISLGRPDGSSVEVRFSARARTPWPGCHASMLIPVDVPDVPDIAKALIDAGFVSRYSVAI
jgi:hypothetical protein